MLNIKIKFSSLNRCFLTTVSNYAELLKKIQEEGPCKPFKVTYEDEDEDNCMIENDQVLQEALIFAKKRNNILKVTVEPDTTHPLDQATQEKRDCMKENPKETKGLEFSEKEALSKKGNAIENSEVNVSIINGKITKSAEEKEKKTITHVKVDETQLWLDLLEFEKKQLRD